MSKKAFKVKKSIVLEPQQTPPSGPESGEIYNDETKGLQQWDNTNSSWQDIGSSSSSGIQYLPNPSAERNTNGWNLYTDFLNCPIADDTTEYVGIKKTSASTLESLGAIRAQQRMQYVGTTPFGGLTLNNSYYISSPALQIGYYGVQLADTLGGSVKNITSNAGANLSGFRPYVPLKGETGNWGTPSITFTRNTSSPLAGEADFILSKPASNCLGEGVSTDFTIDSAYQAQILTVNFLYKVTGTYSSGDITVWIYDKTNNQIIQPVANSVISMGVAGPAQAITFQTAHNSVDYRLIFHVSTTSASAYTLQMTNVFVSPQASPSALTRPPIGTVLSFAGTILPVGFLWCDGSLISRSQYADLFAAIGVAHGSGDGSTTFRVPDYRGRFLRGVAGGSANDPDRASRTAMNTGGATGNNVGSVQGHAFQTHAHNIPYTVVGQGGSGSAMQNGGAGSSTGNASASGATAQASANETRPVNAYVNYIICYSSGNVISSDSAASRAVKFSIRGSASGTLNSSYNNVTFTGAVQEDTHGCWNGTNTYTVKVPGTYRVTSQIDFSHTSVTANQACSASIYRSDVKYAEATTRFPSAATPALLCFVTSEIPCVAGDTIQIRSFTQGTTPTWYTGNGGSTLSISLIQGPSQISAGTVVACRYLVPSTTLAAGEFTIVYPTKSFDTHGAYNPSTGIFTAPAPGFYEISAGYITGAITLGGSGAIQIGFNVNGGSFQRIGWSTGNGTNTNYAVNGTDGCELKTGDTVRILGLSSPSGVISNGNLFIRKLSGVN